MISLLFCNNDIKLVAKIGENTLADFWFVLKLMAADDKNGG